MYRLYFLNMLEVWLSAICSHFPAFPWPFLIFQVFAKFDFQTHYMSNMLADIQELVLGMSLQLAT